MCHYFQIKYRVGILLDIDKVVYRNIKTDFDL